MGQRRFRFVQVTHTYLLDEAQAEKLVAVARALTMDQAADPEDLDAAIVHLEPGDGDDLPVGSAILDVPFPEALVGAELVASTSHELDPREVAELTAHWPADWAESRES